MINDNGDDGTADRREFLNDEKAKGNFRLKNELFLYDFDVLFNCKLFDNVFSSFNNITRSRKS